MAVRLHRRNGQSLTKQNRYTVCQRCFEADISRRWHWTMYCIPCQSERLKDNGGYEAHRAVNSAVARGDLPPARTLACVDCGKPARDYDHRDYGKPLEVEPVCRSCNRLRGPARPVLTFELPDVETA